eukprot:3155062-Rhodomonas_salina.1
MHLRAAHQRIIRPLRSVSTCGVLQARALARELQPAVDTLVCAHWRTGDWAFPLSSEVMPDCLSSTDAHRGLRRWVLRGCGMS